MLFKTKEEEYCRVFWAKKFGYITSCYTYNSQNYVKLSLTLEKLSFLKSQQLPIHGVAESDTTEAI